MAPTTQRDNVEVMLGRVAKKMVVARGWLRAMGARERTGGGDIALRNSIHHGRFCLVFLWVSFFVSCVSPPMGHLALFGFSIIFLIAPFTFFAPILQTVFQCFVFVKRAFRLPSLTAATSLYHARLLTKYKTPQSGSLASIPIRALTNGIIYFCRLLGKDNYTTERALWLK